MLWLSKRAHPLAGRGNHARGHPLTALSNAQDVIEWLNNNGSNLMAFQAAS